MTRPEISPARQRKASAPVSEKFHISVLPLPLLATLSTAAVAVVALVGAAGVWGFGEGEGIALMLVSVGAAWAAAMAALAPAVWANRSPADRLVPGALLMMLTRVVGSGIGAAVLIGLASLPMRPVLAWMLAAYLAVLVAEIVSLVRHMPGDEPEGGPVGAKAHKHDVSILKKESAA